MSIKYTKKVGQLALISLLSIGLVISLGWWLGGAGTETAVAAPVATNTCYATIDGVTVYSDTTSSPVQTAVNAASPNGVIKIAGTCAGVNVTNGFTQTVYISKSLTIQGGYDQQSWSTAPDPVANPTTLDALQLGRVAVVQGTGVQVTLDGLTISRGEASDGTLTNQGGGIWSNSTQLTLTQIILQENSALNSGGGLYSKDTNAIVTISDSTIRENRAIGYDGGGVFHPRGLLTIKSTQFISNTTDDGSDGGEGGAIYLGNGTAIIEDTDFISNTSGYAGGAIIWNTTVVTLTHSLFENNHSYDGGAVSDNGSAATVYIEDTTFSKNSSIGVGAALHMDGTNAATTIIDSLFEENNAGVRGAAIQNDGKMTIQNSSFLTNSVGTAGGAIYSQGIITVTQSTFSGNEAGNDGGGIYVSNSGLLTMQSSVLMHNNAPGDGSTSGIGGAIYLVAGAGSFQTHKKINK